MSLSEVPSTIHNIFFIESMTQHIENDDGDSKGATTTRGDDGKGQLVLLTTPIAAHGNYGV